MILPPDDVGDPHLQIIYHVHQMKHRLTVGSNNDKIRINRLAIGQFPPHVAHDQILDDHGLRSHAKKDRPLLLVGFAGTHQIRHAPLVNLAPLRLKIGTASPDARSLKVSGGRPLIPFQSEPA